MDNKRKAEYDKIYIEMAYVLSKLSYAEKYKVGCLIVSDSGQIISQGYNGTPTGFDNTCEDATGCMRFNGDGSKCFREFNPVECKGCNHCKLTTRPEVLHAESNAISKCAQYNSSTKNATLYVTLSPCKDCAKLIIQAGISRVVYAEKYHRDEGVDLLKRAGISVICVHDL